MCKVSVIIPCYNQGHWLKEAIDSALMQDIPQEDLEVIVLDDGSTNPVTQRILKKIDHSRVQVYRQKNQGLAAARNTAIEKAKGRYILPLDSDDRIHHSYIKKAMSVLENQPDVGIVYCLAEWFGEKQGLWEVPEYAFPEILIQPQIFASALYRKADWEAVGGYKTDMIYGWEDYEFWLSLIERGLQVHRIEEVLFSYRQTEGSMAGLDRAKMLYSFKKLYEHHPKLYQDHISVLFDAVIETNPYRHFHDSRDTFQLYIPSKEGYLAENALEQHYPTGVWSRVHFIVRHDLSNTNLPIRIDPGSKLGVYDIASIKVKEVTTGNSILVAQKNEEFEKTALAGDAIRLAHARFLRVLNIGNDPYFYLPELPEKSLKGSPVELEFWVYRHPGLSVLKDSFSIHHLQADQLATVQDLKAQISRLSTVESEQALTIRELNGDIKLQKSEIHNLQGTAKSIQAELITLQTQHHQLAERNQKLEEDLAKQMGEKAALESELKALREKNDSTSSPKLKKRKFF